MIGLDYLKNFISQVTGRLVTVIASFLVFVWVARFLGAVPLGQFSYILTVIGVFSVIAEFGTTPMLAKDLGLNEGDKERYWGNFLFLRILLSLIVILPMGLLAYYSTKPIKLYLFISLPFMFFISSRFFDPVFQLHNKASYSLWPSLIHGLFYMVLTGILLHYDYTLEYILAIYVISNMIYFISAFILSRRMIKPNLRFSLPKMKSIFLAAAPVGVSSIFMMINSRADIFVLSYLKSDYEVGLYNAAYKFLDIASMSSVMLVTPFIPIFSANYVKNRAALKDQYTRLLEGLGVLLLPIPVLLPFFSADLIGWVYGMKFLGSTSVLNILSWVGLLVFFSVFGSVLCVSAGIVRQAYWSSALIAVVNILLNFLLIPKFSYLGSAWATLVSEVFIVIICYWYLTKYFGNLFNFDKWLKILSVNGVIGVCFWLVSLHMNKYVTLILLGAAYFLIVIKYVFNGCLFSYMVHEIKI